MFAQQAGSRVLCARWPTCAHRAYAGPAPVTAAGGQRPGCLTREAGAAQWAPSMGFTPLPKIHPHPGAVSASYPPAVSPTTPLPVRGRVLLAPDSSGLSSSSCAFTGVTPVLLTFPSFGSFVPHCSSCPLPPAPPSYFFCSALLGLREAEGRVPLTALSVPTTVPGPQGRAMASPWMRLPVPTGSPGALPSFFLCVYPFARCALQPWR